MRVCPKCSSRFLQDEKFCPHDGSPTEEPKPEEKGDPLLGTTIDGRYRVEKQIGEGGMGLVYQAVHTVLGKRLALKVLRGDLARDQDLVQRFIQEAQAATSIGHENIVDISDFGRLPDGSVYFVMEFLDGKSLTQAIHEGLLPLDTALPVIRQVASALGAAHARGIVHRDLKPENIFLVKKGGKGFFAKVLDFGIAKVAGATASRLTRTGVIFGTPHYMAPEQAAGQSVDQRADIYALGVIMYEIVTGRVPFDADTTMGVLTKHMFEPPVPPSRTGQLTNGRVSALDPIILKALAKKPEGRYQNMDELLADLDELVLGATVATPIAIPPTASGAGAGAAPTTPAAGVEAQHTSPVRARTDESGDDDAVPLPRPKLPMGLVFGGAAVAAVVVIVGAVAIVGSGSGNKSAPDAQPAVRRQGAAPAESTHTGALPAPATPTVLTLATTPPGAEVLVHGAVVGNTPTKLPRPATSDEVVRVRLAGYQEEEVRISPRSPESVAVTLKPVAKAPPAAENREPTTRGRSEKRRSKKQGDWGTGVSYEVVDPWGR